MRDNLPGLAIGTIATGKERDMKLFIGICNSQENIPSSFFWSVARMTHICPTIMDRGTHPWDVIRNNQLIDNFLKTDCDYFVKMDVDQVYPYDYFAAMVPLLATHDIIGPMIFDRHNTFDFMPLCFETDKDEPLAKRGKPFDNKTGIMELPYLHTNCFYNRYALEAIPKPWYEAHATPDGLARANHVDYTFMSKFTAAGFKIYINFDMVVPHLAQVAVTREFHEIYNAGKAALND